MLKHLMRLVFQRAPSGVARVSQPSLPGRPPLLSLATQPSCCAAHFSTLIRQPLLRPGASQLCAAHRSSFLGSACHWQQQLGVVSWRHLQSTGEHSRHHDPRSELLLRNFASSHPEQPAGPATATKPRDSEGPAAGGGNGTGPSGNGAALATPPPAAASPPHEDSSVGSSSTFSSSYDSSSEGDAPIPGWKQRLGHYLESDKCHMIVVWLVMLDLSIVVTELILGSLYSGQHMPHAVHVAEEILSWSSIGILGVFATELLAKLVCFGTQFFTHSKWHFFDAVVVTLSLCLELTLKGVAQEAASLLVFFRLWKYTPEFLRAARHAPEAMEVARVARHSPEVVRALSHVPEALRVARHSPELARLARAAPEALRVFRHVPEFFRFLRHTPELFRLWRVARIAHGAAQAMELQHAKEADEQRHRLAQLEKDLSTERRRVLLLEAEVLAMKEHLTPEQQQGVVKHILESMPPPKAGEGAVHMDAVWEVAAREHGRDGGRHHSGRGKHHGPGHHQGSH